MPVRPPPSPAPKHTKNEAVEIVEFLTFTNTGRSKKTPLIPTIEGREQKKKPFQKHTVGQVP